MITIKGIASSMRRFGFLICWIMGLGWMFEFIERKRKSQKITTCLFNYIVWKSESRVPKSLRVYIERTLDGDIHLNPREKLMPVIYEWVHANFPVAKAWFKRVQNFREQKAARIKQQRELSAA